MKELLAISPGNIALEFLDKRIADNNYRGDESSQHNRYTKEKVIAILKLLNKYAMNGTLLTIRNTDISKRPNNTPEEAQYARFCVEAKIITEIGTQDAMRKNLFVDFHRMGFINRYNRNGDKVAPFTHSNIRYVSLSKQGLKLINAKDLEEQFFIFSKGVDAMLGGYINLLLEIFRNPEYKIDNITTYEYMFFVSAVQSNTAFSITTQECIDFIQAYRALSRGQQNGVIDVLKDKMQPKNYTGNKTDKRDFHNWWNKAEQLFSVITQTIYFEQRDDKLVPRELRNVKDGRASLVKLSRSISEKFEYYSRHKVGKARVLGFELHHVVPLAWAESREQFKLLDIWQNMVYIDAFSHAKITQNNNRNVVMSNKNTTIILSDYLGNKVELVFNRNIQYLSANLPTMLDYNVKLLNMYETAESIAAIRGGTNT